MDNRVNKLIEYVLQLNARGFDVLPVDQNNSPIAVEFESEADVPSKMSKLTGSMVVKQLALVGHDIAAIEINKQILDAYDTLTLINDDGHVIYIFEAPELSYSMRSAAYALMDPHDPDKEASVQEEARRLSFFQKVDRQEASSLELMFLTNDIVKFRVVVDPKKPVAPFPDELLAFMQNTRWPARSIRREELADGCYVYRSQETLPFATGEDLRWKKMKYTIYGRKRKSVHERARLTLDKVPRRILAAVSRLLVPEKAKLLKQNCTSQLIFRASGPACLIFYGMSAELSVPARRGNKDGEVSQGDMLFVSNGEVTMMPDAYADADDFRIILLVQ